MKTKTKTKRISTEEKLRLEQEQAKLDAEDEEQTKLERAAALHKAYNLTVKLFGTGHEGFEPEPALVFELHSSMMAVVEEDEDGRFFAEDEFLANMEEAKVIAESVFSTRTTPYVVISTFDRVFLESDDEDFDENEEEEENE